MPKTPFRGVLAGCGFFARNHMHGWAGTDNADIVAVCDIDRERAYQFAAAFGVPKAYTDAEEMFRQERPDFADIVTTVETHRPLVELATGFGAATICQKPFALTYADGAAMVSAAEKAGVPLLVHENFRWQKPFRMMRASLDAGEIGTPQFLRLSFRHGFDVYANQPYLKQVDDLALMDVGLHLFDLARFLVGDATSLHCRTQRLNPVVRGEDAFLASLRHANGVVSAIDCSFFSKIEPEPFPETLAWLEGDRGSLEVTAGYQLRLHAGGRCETRDAEPDIPPWGARPWHGVQDSVAAFEAHVVDVLSGRADGQPTGKHNLGTLAMTIAAYRSADRGEVIDLAGFIREGAVR